MSPNVAPRVAQSSVCVPFTRHFPLQDLDALAEYYPHLTSGCSAACVPPAPRTIPIRRPIANNEVLLGTKQFLNLSRFYTFLLITRGFYGPEYDQRACNSFKSSRWSWRDSLVISNTSKVHPACEGHTETRPTQFRICFPVWVYCGIIPPHGGSLNIRFRQMGRI